MKRVLFVSAAVALLAVPALAQDADVDPNAAEVAALSGGGNWSFGTCAGEMETHRAADGQSGACLRAEVIGGALPVEAFP